MVTIPKTCGEISTAWLNDTLGDDATRGAKVNSVEVEVIGVGVGFMGEVARLTLTYDQPDVGVTSMIAKVPSLEEGPRLLGQILGLYHKEFAFYRNIAAEVDVFVPQAYVNLADPDTGDYVLILEDLAPMHAGDQLASCSLEQASAALSELANLHARWWENPQLEEFSSWLPGYGDDFFKMAIDAYVGAIDIFLDTWGDDVPETIRRSLEHDKIDPGSIERRTAIALDRPPKTYLHGDFRLDNMLFGESGDDRVAIIDWQLGRQTNPMFDVVYFLAGNFSREFRQAHERDLVEHYRQRLLAGGVVDYSFEQCWTDYRVAASGLLTYSVIGAGTFDPEATNDRGRELFEVMFERYMGVIIDLDTLSLFD